MKRLTIGKIRGLMDIDNAQERVQYLKTTGVDRLKRLTEVANRYAVPWYKKLGMAAQELAQVPERWYANIDSGGI